MALPRRQTAAVRVVFCRRRPHCHRRPGDSGDYDRAERRWLSLPNTGMAHGHDLARDSRVPIPPTGPPIPLDVVHVDITFHYLITVEHYVSASGDTQFCSKIARTGGCLSIRQISAECGRSPAPHPRQQRRGQRTGQVDDDLGLSTSWLGLRGHLPGSRFQGQRAWQRRPWSGAKARTSVARR